MFQEGLKILKPNDAAGMKDLAERGIEGMKERLQECRWHDPLVGNVWSLCDAMERHDGVRISKEDRYAMLAYHALTGKLIAEKKLLDIAMRTIDPILMTRHK